MNRMIRVSRGTLFAVASRIRRLRLCSGAGVGRRWTMGEDSHPRREEVNARLANQNRRINKEVREGEISRGQAAKLHQQDHRIRMVERAMASTNGGHITKTEQRALNQQENQVSREIGH